MTVLLLAGSNEKIRRERERYAGKGKDMPGSYRETPRSSTRRVRSCGYDSVRHPSSSSTTHQFTIYLSAIINASSWFIETCLH